MVKLFENRRPLLLSWLILVLSGLITVALLEKGDGVMYFNSFRTDALNDVFAMLTLLGEYQGFLLGMALIAIAGSYRHVLGYLVAVAIMLLLVYLLKNFAFDDAIRPIVFFENRSIDLGFKPDFHINRQHSFPSGHTTAGFCYFFFAALCIDRYVLQLPVLILGLCVAISRIYLVQHFVLDTVAGCVLGGLIALITYALIFKKERSHTFLDKKIIPFKGR